MRSTGTYPTWWDAPSSDPIRLTYLEEQVRLAGWARRGAVLAQRYELEVPLAVPTPGTLWHARQLRLRAPVTLQLLDPALVDDPGMLDAFFHEARAAATIDHAHVARVLDYGVDYGLDAGVPFLVLEPLVGETLADRVLTRHALPAPELARVFREAALGLAALHGWGLVHRRLDPAHVFLAPGEPGEVTKLLFGIDQIFGDSLCLVRRLSHQIAGRSGANAACDAEARFATTEYQSPEQLLGHGPVDERSDLWSLAVIAFEALTGTPAFGGSNLGDHLVQICSGEPNKPPTDVALPAGFESWFQKGVSKLPSKRFASARAMAEALVEVLEPSVGSLGVL